MNKNITLSLIAGLYIVIIGQLVGCADTGDDPCDPETGEECDDAREVPRGGGFLPYEPEENPGPQGKLQALTPTGMPHGVWVHGFIEAVDATWNITTGGFNRFRRKAQLTPTVATYHTEVAEAVLGKRLWKWKCAKVGTSTSARCEHSGRVIYAHCPTASFAPPQAYDYGQVGNPSYNFPAEFSVSRNAVLSPSRLDVGSYLETDGKRHPELICRYPIGYREITVSKKRPSTF